MIKYRLNIFIFLISSFLFVSFVVKVEYSLACTDINGNQMICTINQTCCEGIGCVNLDTNSANCGACGNYCRVGELCAGGVCRCTDGDGILRVCSATENCCPDIGCADLTSNPRSCAACGLKCGRGEICDNGSCRCGTLIFHGGSVCNYNHVCTGNPPGCWAEKDAECGTVICGQYQNCCDQNLGRCSDLLVDSENCGACGTVCGFGKRCNNGVCELDCQPGLTDCDGDCVDLDSSTQHCGRCDIVCGFGERCNSGICELNCQVGLVNCEGVCVDLNRSNQNCGACRDACLPGEICDGTGSCSVECQPGRVQCGYYCVDLNTSNQNCGICGNTCPTGFTCLNGKCELQCQQGLANCGGVCVDPETANQNCGTCGNSCPAGFTCQGGECELQCQLGLVNCGGVCVDLNTANQNCGVCGNSCTSGFTCNEGACSLQCQEGLSECGGLCIDLENSNQNCGNCGNECDPGKICKRGICRLECQTGLTYCGGTYCVNLKTSNDHCGSCIDTCPDGTVCSNGSCTTDCQHQDCSDLTLEHGFNLVSFTCVSDFFTAFQCLKSLSSSSIISIQKFKTEDGVFDSATINDSTTPRSVVGVDFPILRDEGYIIYTKDVWTNIGPGEPCDERKICLTGYTCAPEGVCVRTD